MCRGSWGRLEEGTEREEDEERSEGETVSAEKMGGNSW